MILQICLIKVKFAKNCDGRKVKKMETKNKSAGKPMFRRLQLETLKFTIICSILVIFCGCNLAQTAQKQISTDDYYKFGLAMIAEQKCPEAINYFDRGIEINPNEAKFYFAYIECLPKEKRLEYLNKAISLKPDYAEAYFERAQLKNYKILGGKMTADESRNMLDDYNKAIEFAPENSEYYRERGYFYFHQLNEREKAFQDYDKMIALSPNKIDYLLVRAGHYQYVGKLEKAVADCTAVLQLNPNDLNALDRRAAIYLQNGEYEKAIADLSAEIAIKPFASSYQNRAQAYRKLGKIKMAQADELKVKLLMKQDSEEFKNEFTSDNDIEYWESSSLTEADAEILSMTENDLSQLVKASGLAGFDNYRNALEIVSKIIEKYPNLKLPIQMRSYYYYKTGELKLAIKDLTRLIESGGDTPEVYHNRGLVYLQNKEYKSAVQDLSKAIENSPMPILSFQLRAKAYRKLGKTAEAADDEKMAEKLN